MEVGDEHWLKIRSLKTGSYQECFTLNRNFRFYLQNNRLINLIWHEHLLIVYSTNLALKLVELSSSKDDKIHHVLPDRNGGVGSWFPLILVVIFGCSAFLVRLRLCQPMPTSSLNFNLLLLFLPLSCLFSLVQGLVAACCMDPRDRKAFRNAGTKNQAYRLMREPWMLRGFNYSWLSHIPFVWPRTPVSARIVTLFLEDRNNIKRPWDAPGTAYSVFKSLLYTINFQGFINCTMDKCRR